jgi:hypothetical protein
VRLGFEQGQPWSVQLREAGRVAAGGSGCSAGLAAALVAGTVTADDSGDREEDQDQGHQASIAAASSAGMISRAPSMRT